MSLNDASLWIVIIGGVVGLPSILAGWVKWIRPRYQLWHQRRLAEHEALAGRPAVVDKATGKQLAPARPGIGEWMGSIDDKLNVLAEAVKSNQHAHERIDRLEDRMASNEEQIAALHRAQMERIATKAENAAAMGLFSKLHGRDEDGVE